jgi:hypothetical protein
MHSYSKSCSTDRRQTQAPAGPVGSSNNTGIQRARAAAVGAVSHRRYTPTAKQKPDALRAAVPEGFSPHTPAGLTGDDAQRLHAWTSTAHAADLPGHLTAVRPSPDASTRHQHCTLGVGCEEGGRCYAEAMGEPDRCGLGTRPYTPDAAESRGFDSEGARRFIVGWVRRHGEVSGEDLVEAAQEHGFRGKDARCFGGVFVAAINRGELRVIRSDLPRKRGHGTSGGRLYGVAA